MAPAPLARCYMRVSTEEQAQSGYSLAGQQEKLELFCRLQGYAIGGWYRDDGVSAKDLNRPAFRRMMADSGPGDVIVAYKLDRLTRSVRDLDHLLGEFETRSLHFRSVTEQFDTTTATGRLMIRMVGEFAQWERETIAERTAFGKQKKRAAGEWGGGRPPLGYALAPSDRVKGGRTLMKLVPDPATAPLVAAIFERYLAGNGVRAIATWLNTELGARSALGRKFDAVKVARILQNPMYVGLLASGVPSTHPPLISVPLFERVQQIFARRKLMAPRQATGSYPLSGVAVCGVCGGPVRVQQGRRAGLYYYCCRNHYAGLGCGERPLTSAPGPAMEALVVQAIAAMGEPLQVDAFFRQVDDEDPGFQAGELQRLQADLGEAERAICRWDQLYEAGKLEMEAYVQRVAPHQERLQVLQRQLTRVKNAPPQAAPVAVTFPAVWAAAEAGERKMLLRHFTEAWGVRIALCPGRGLRLEPAAAGR